MTLEIVGAGFPRTGTSSLKAALERLGFAPCGHMVSIAHDPSRAPAWLDAWDRTRRGVPVDWDAVVRDDRATVDLPACLFWRELAAAYPGARVILGVRDPERWYESVRETIYASSGPDADPSRFVDAPPEIRAGIVAITELVRVMFWDGVLDGRFLDRDFALGVFEAHNAAVRAALPPDRLLVWEAVDGWEPLGSFLGVPVPDEPFPRVNDRAEFRSRLEGGPGASAWRERG